MPDHSTEIPIRICDSRALINGGLAIKHPITDSTGPCSAIFIRYQDQVYGYVNRCAHIGVELDWEGSVFTRAGDLLMCARHGATYQPDTGLCVGGPCKNGKLRRLRVEERADGVYWLSQGAVVKRPEPESENTP